MNETHTVKTASKAKLTGNFLSKPQQINAQIDMMYTVKTAILIGPLMKYGVHASSSNMVTPTNPVVKIN